MLLSSLPTKCISSPASTNFLANDEPIEPEAPKIIFFITKVTIIMS